MTTLTCTRGLPGSGKTSWALDRLASARPGTVARVNRDEIRAMLHGSAPHLGATERQVSTVQHGMIETLLRSGVGVIVDDTNLAARRLRELAEIAWRCGAEFAVQDFTDVPLSTCVQRDAGRAGAVGEDVIRDMHTRYLAGRTLPLPVPRPRTPPIGRRYLPDPSLPLAVLVDIDGTVALAGNRNPYDASRYHEDLPNEPVIAAVRAVATAGYRILFCSGREEAHREVTEGWLADHVGVAYDVLVMRPTGDRRPDDVVKLELFDRHIRDRYRVAWVLDDRERVVAAWRSIGLTVFQVAEGRF